MLVLDRRTGQWIDSEFRNLPEFLKPSDVLVVNDTRVIRARIGGRLERANGGTRGVEVLFAARVTENEWEVLCRPGKRIRKGDRIVFGNGTLQGVFGDVVQHGLRLLHVSASVEKFLDAHGHVPLPPYINRDDTSSDAIDYQTIYACAPGAVAAPTAGLHFTESMFAALREKRIELVKITLHVGIGTFIPVRTEDPAQHVVVQVLDEPGRPGERHAPEHDHRRAEEHACAVGAVYTGRL